MKMSSQSKKVLKLLSHLRSKRMVFAASVGLLSLVVVFSIVLVGYSLAFREKIFPNTYVGSLELGGKSLAEAEAVIAARATERKGDFTLTIHDHEPAQISLDDINFTYDAPTTARSSFTIGREGFITTKIAHVFRSFFTRNLVPAAFRFDEGKLNGAIETTVTKIGTPAVDARIVLGSANTPVLEPAKSGLGLRKQSMLDAVMEALRQMKYDTALAPEVLQPRIVESQLTDAMGQTQLILGHAPVTFIASDVTLEADIPKIFSWITYTENQPELKNSGSPLSWWSNSINQAHADILPKFNVQLSPDLIKNYIGTVAVTVNNESTNAEIRAIDGKITVIKEHIDGEKLLIDEASALIVNTLTQPAQSEKTVITLPVERIVADIRSDTIEDLGIKELIASAETNFRGSPANRIHNINTGARFLTGSIVPKGQEFSTVKILGKVDGSTGYLPELVIKENRTIPEYGGGLCQVSTTLFRSVLNAGLKVTERSNHSYRVAYYEPPVGLDATIYLPKPDFKFLNDTPGYILVQSKVEGTKITFELYGTKDGRIPSVTEPIVTDVTEPPEAVYAETDTLPKGETKQIEKAHPGATAIATYTVMRDGQEINKQVFRSRYKPWQARFLVGTKE